MTNKRILTLSTSLLLLSGCAVMSKTDCIDADWEREGYKVGMNGERDRVDSFNRRAETCSKHGVNADLEAFEAGYEEGIIAYCEVENAVTLGIKAKGSALEFCSEFENPGFAAAYSAGYKLHELRREALAARNELQRLENLEYRSRQQIRDLYRTASSEASTDQQREAAARTARRLRRNIGDLRRSIDYLQGRYYRAQEAAEVYEELLRMEYEL